MTTHIASDTGAWHDDIVHRTAAGARFAGLYGDQAQGVTRLVAVLDLGDGYTTIATPVTPDRGELNYPSLTRDIPSAFWYERAAHDLSGLVAQGHPRLEPLLLPLADGSDRPSPGAATTQPQIIGAPDAPGPRDVDGHGLFALTFGPVRSGVAESIEFLIETPGEDIPHLNIRPHFKHRGIAKQFEGRPPADGILVAERVEGIASVAHALAFAHATEAAADVTPPLHARLVRVIVAELERIANHLDVAMRLTDAAGLAVAASRFGWHKETTMRLQSRITGSRFGRTAVIPGGVRDGLATINSVFRADLRRLHARVDADATRAMRTPSFLDRIRGTGLLDNDYAATWGLLGPIGRASARPTDIRWAHPYDAYPDLRLPAAPATATAGDARARLEVRWQEIDIAFGLIDQAAAALTDAGGDTAVPDVRPHDGVWIGAAEAPQGEVLYAVTFRDGLVSRCFARSASLHNLVAFHDAFHTDIFTDFPFIEASFGLSYAGVAM